MVDAFALRNVPLKIFACERVVDPKGGARSLRGGDDRQLHVADDIAGDKHSGDAGGLVLPTPYSATMINHAAQLMGERGLRE